MPVNRPIKTLHVTVGFDYGGTEKMLACLLPRLDPRKYKAIAVCLKGWGPMAKDLMEAGVHTLVLGVKGRFDPLVIWRLYRCIHRIRPVILHSYLYRANVPCRLLGHLLRVPLILSSVREMGPWMKIHHRLIDRLSARYSTLITTNSDRVNQLLSERIGIPLHKFVTIPNGVDLEQYKSISPPPRTNKQSRIGFIGRLDEPTKGLSYLLDALHSLEPRVECWIVGDGPAMTSLKGRCSRLGLTKRVRFLGKRRDIPQLFGELDLLVLPSLWEGSPNVLIEAMAAKKAVVATYVGGIPEIVIQGKTGLMVPPANAHDLSQAIRYLLNHPEEREAMGEAGYKRVSEHFTIEKQLIALTSLYDQLIKEKIDL